MTTAMSWPMETLYSETKVGSRATRCPRPKQSQWLRWARSIRGLQCSFLGAWETWLTRTLLFLSLDRGAWARMLGHVLVYMTECLLEHSGWALRGCLLDQAAWLFSGDNC